MNKKRFSSPSGYLDSVAQSNAYSFVPVSLAAEFLNVTPSMINDLLKNGSLDAVVVNGSRKNWKGVLVESLMTYTKNKRTSVTSMIKQIRHILETAAKKKRKMFYSDLMEQVGLSYQNPYHRRLIGECLGKLSAQTFKEKNYMLSALAVLKSTGRPNEIFFELANELGALDDTQKEKDFYQSQIKKIYGKYKT
ncbi:hypothetical protein [Candidatus Manganitrophus noduliformans]|uniref:Helix-turn-helix domain-containing protein n=1 Tax=Candidatus Manganitrophus noduliformans TaxID=2606439 RepID=A0A7X6DQ58_9BACT|nr:hypothetical protein [Candidatus Manganitrophus noduliformans]NKE71264.1 hypothetical protein [Candidatus Manganitrophus noduliformans]